MKKLIAILSFACLLFTNQAIAKKDIYSSQPITGTGWSNPVSLTVQVPSPPVISFGGFTNLIYKTKSLNSYVKFWLNTENIPAGMNTFTATVSFTVSYMLEGATTPITNAKTLVIDYNAGNGIKYKNLALENFPNAASLTISNITIQVNVPLPILQQQQFLSLQLFTEHERFYNYQNIYGGIPSLYPLPAPSASYSATNNEITISWNAEQYAEGYELEYSFVDDYSNVNYNLNFIPANQLNFSFQNNSTRILTEQISYTMPLVQEHGYFVFRVRGYSMAGPDFSRIFYGVYNAQVDGNQLFTVQSYPYQYYVNGVNQVHVKDKMNWQSVTTFAEEGKSKTVVKYMDGKLLNRQTVTSTSTEQNAIVAETIYDFQGRPAVNILPAPVDNPKITYYPNFNQNMQGQPFTAADFNYLDISGCNYNINPLKQQNSIGAANYYSKYNPNKTAFNAFIPEANGYPFTAVTYMPDLTDRVVRQGNVGETFQPGNTAVNGTTTYKKHDTKYYYGKPNQQELDYLFGTNVGYAEFYQKNLVIDPNGQSSVSYVDLDGKTIATALAGNAPPGLDPLRSNNSFPINVNLLSGTDIINEQEHSLTSSQSFLVPANGTVYNFNYSISDNTYDALSCNSKTYCLDCIYDLEITLVNDECSKIEYQQKQTVGTLTNLNFLCNDANASHSSAFNATLNTGSYTITRKLTVNKQAAEFYADSIINDPNNSCLKTFDDFYNEAWNNRDTLRCKDACTSCTEEANASEEASLIANAVRACDSLWCKPQLTTLCDVARMSMVNDVTPGGQYAIFKDANGNIDMNASLISIFNAEIQLGINRILSNGNISNINVDLPGEPTQTLAYYLSDNIKFTQLINNWPDDLSELLLPLHPEYCYLKFCEQQYVQQGNTFDTRYMNANTLADAQNEFGNQVNATNIISFYANDQFYNGLPSVLQTQMATRFSNYTGQANPNSIVQLAVFLANCPSGNNINNCNGAWGDGINDDEEWEKFKAIYFSIKQEFIQKAREYYVRNTAGCCPNNYINCGSNSTYCPPVIWNGFGFGTVSTTYPCFNNISNFDLLTIRNIYQDAKRRFVTINDIDFPGLPDPTKSIYDMTTQELTDYIKSDSIQSPCPSCPELDAFKMMIWQMADKNWFANGAAVKADAIMGLKDALRQRFVGSQANDNITIIRNGNDITISSKNCTMIFKADTTINWEKVSILPTCLEIKDYKNAKLHIMVDGAYKTVLNITSTCDIFYCDGEKPAPPDPDNSCHCDSIYNTKKIYHIGDIAQYKGICYIVTKVNNANGDLTPGYHPENKEFWNRLCEAQEICINPFNINFDSQVPFVSSFTAGNMPLLGNDYTIRNNYTVPPFNVNFSSNVMLARSPTTISNPLIIQKTATVIPNKNYKLSFDWNYLRDPQDPDVYGIELKINNQTVYIIPDITGSGLSGWQHYIYNWNSSINTSFDVKLFSLKENKSDILAIDNFKLECEGAVVNINTKNRTGKNQDEKSTNRYIPQNTCGCNGLCDADLPSPELPMIPCDSILKDLATQQATEAYANYKDSVYNAILNGYYTKCLQSIETFKMDYKNAEYHYTLYYYNQSGNLVQTVPPAGVKPFTNPADTVIVQARRANINAPPYVPAHIMKTNYRHNSLNAVVWQRTPDAGISNFFYDKLGRIVMSQNANQAALVPMTRQCSYTKYDALGRTVEAGVVRTGGFGVFQLKLQAFNFGSSIILWNNYIDTKPRTEITKTFYDNSYLGISGKINIAFTNGQQNLRNRIGTVAYFANNTNLAAYKYDHATHYNYDIAGNVTDMLQDFGTASDFGFTANNVRTQSKHIAYRFDLVSGKVNEVQYQQGYADQFLYKYEYNADNKLTKVFTSTNGLVWENDARYFYYRHGPLARTELGTDIVQGIDYAYTLQGWIKGVNGKANTPGEDIGQDGTPANNTNIGYQAQNKNTAPDVFSYWLGYHQDDYSTIANVLAYIPTAINSLQTGAYHTTPADLFNGNIHSMYTNLQPFGGLGMHYRYDQLNRIKKQEGFDVNTQVPVANNVYTMQLEYDPNGNIQKLLRNGKTSLPAMDSLNYYYYRANGAYYTNDPALPDATNKLAFVTDYMSNTNNYNDDIDKQPVNNYAYDAIGNLIRDTKEGIVQIKWNLQNKITAVIKSNGKNVFYNYDALGSRIKKVVINTTPGFAPKTEYYVRDAQGNTLAIYEMKNDDLHWAEQHIYGSSRLGIYKPDLNFNMPQPGIYTTRNTTQYELTNHLGNVLATITDSKTNTNTATLLTATDYYAFGMAMPDRKYSLNNAKFRYGFNGKENDEETGTQDYGYRIYNPALGRFLSVDRLTKDYSWYSPYQFAGNKPIQAIDLDGLEEFHVYKDYYLNGLDGKLELEVMIFLQPEYVQNSTTPQRRKETTPGANDFNRKADVWINGVVRSFQVWHPMSQESLVDEQTVLMANGANLLYRDGKGKTKANGDKWNISSVSMKFNTSTTVYYGTNLDYNATGLSEIDKITEVLLLNPELSVSVTGNTSRLGSEIDNMNLSFDRAIDMKNQIISTASGKITGLSESDKAKVIQSLDSRIQIIGAGEFNSNNSDGTDFSGDRNVSIKINIPNNTRTTGPSSTTKGDVKRNHIFAEQ